MVLLRNYEEKEGVFVFDFQLDHQLSTYESKHLDLLEEIESDHFWFKNRREKICQIFLKYVNKTARILEIGSGTGFVAEKLKKAGFSVEVSDIYSNGLHYAKKKGFERLYQFDLFNPPFYEEFDVICLFDVLEHLNDENLALNCLKKMLKPGGLIILTVPAHKWLWSRDDLIGGHKRRYTRHSLKAAFNAAGLTPVDLSYFFTFILPFLILRRFLRKDPGEAVNGKDRLKLKLNFFLNQTLHGLTWIENYLEKIVPNIAGGSLIGIARKTNLF